MKTAQNRSVMSTVATIFAPLSLLCGWKSLLRGGLQGFSRLKTLILYESGPPRGQSRTDSSYVRRRPYTWRTFRGQTHLRAVEHGCNIWKAAKMADITVQIILTYADKEAYISTFGVQAVAPVHQRMLVADLPFGLEAMARKVWTKDVRHLEKQALSREKAKENGQK